jgi:actin-like ATPase involved in cell morphogenesis
MAVFLTQLSEIIDHNNLDDKQIVIAVPSYFTEIEKKSLLNAA